MTGANLRSRGFKRQRSEQAHGSAWHDWTPESKGFNHEAFKGLSTEDYGRLNALGLGPSGITVPGRNDPFSRGHGYWADGPNQDIDPFTNAPYGDRHRFENSRRNADNRGVWENAVQATGKFNINNAEELMGFVSEIENYKAGNADFMKDGKLTGKDVWNLKENWNQAEPETAAPEVTNPAVQQQQQQQHEAVVAENKTPKSPTAPVTGIGDTAAQQALARTNTFTSDTYTPPKTTEESQQAALDLNEKFKFNIKDNLEPSPANTENAIATALSSTSFW